jgi:hypothetical protein
VKRLIVAAIAAFAPVVALAQISDTESAAANARIIRGIGIVRTQDLWFGDLLSPIAAGTVTVSPGSVRTNSAGITLAGGTVSAASFTVNENATGNPKFWVQVPVNATLTRAGGGATMTVTNFTANVDPTCISTTGVKPPGAPGQCPNSNQGFLLNVGGRLNVGAAQPSGAYSGLFTVTVHRL